MGPYFDCLIYIYINLILKLIIIIFIFFFNFHKDWPLEFSSYLYEVEFVDLIQDNIVKTFIDFGLEWDIQFTLTILNEISSDWHNIMYISGTYINYLNNVLHFLLVVIAHIVLIFKPKIQDSSLDLGVFFRIVQISL